MFYDFLLVKVSDKISFNYLIWMALMRTVELGIPGGVVAKKDCEKIATVFMLMRRGDRLKLFSYTVRIFHSLINDETF